MHWCNSVEQMCCHLISFHRTRSNVSIVYLLHMFQEYQPKCQRVNSITFHRTMVPEKSLRRHSPNYPNGVTEFQRRSWWPLVSVIQSSLISRGYKYEYMKTRSSSIGRAGWLDIQYRLIGGNIQCSVWSTSSVQPCHLQNSSSSSKTHSSTSQTTIGESTIVPNALRLGCVSRNDLVQCNKPFSQTQNRSTSP